MVGGGSIPPDISCLDGPLAFLIFGPLANLALWAVAIQWYFPHKLPLTWGFKYCGEVFKPTSDTLAALGTSVLIACITVVVCLLMAVPAGYALGRLRLPRLLVPSVGFMLLIERFLKAETLAKIG